MKLQIIQDMDKTIFFLQPGYMVLCHKLCHHLFQFRILQWEYTKPDQSISKLNLWKPRYCIYRSASLLSSKVGPFSMHALFPPFLPVPKVPFIFSFWNFWQLLLCVMFSFFPHHQTFLSFKVFSSLGNSHSHI